jgi:hypothetical protein
MTRRWRERGLEPSVRLDGELGHVVVVKPPIVRVDELGERFAARLGRLHMDKAELEIGLGDFENVAASPFALSARVEICRGDRSCHHGESPK